MDDGDDWSWTRPMSRGRAKEKAAWRQGPIRCRSRGDDRRPPRNFSVDRSRSRGGRRRRG